MPSRHTEFSRRAVCCLFPAALLALTPKCVLCVLAYAGLGAALGLGGPEICGASGDPLAAWTSWLACLGVAMRGRDLQPGPKFMRSSASLPGAGVKIPSTSVAK